MNRQQRRKFYKKFPAFKKEMRKCSLEAVDGLEQYFDKKWNKLKQNNQEEKNENDNG